MCHFPFAPLSFLPPLIFSCQYMHRCRGMWAVSWWRVRELWFVISLHMKTFIRGQTHHLHSDYNDQGARDEHVYACVRLCVYVWGCLYKWGRRRWNYVRNLAEKCSTYIRFLWNTSRNRKIAVFLLTCHIFFYSVLAIHSDKLSDFIFLPLFSELKCFTSAQCSQTQIRFWRWFQSQKTVGPYLWDENTVRVTRHLCSSFPTRIHGFQIGHAFTTYYKGSGQIKRVGKRGAYVHMCDEG